jgi:hypothetical protein
MIAQVTLRVEMAVTNLTLELLIDLACRLSHANRHEAILKLLVSHRELSKRLTTAVARDGGLDAQRAKKQNMIGRKAANEPVLFPSCRQQATAPQIWSCGI